MPWDAAVPDPVAAVATARGELGDTFSVESGGTTYLFVFSPTGIRSFYALPEDRASKGVADWMMLRRKVPDELFDGRRTFPHELFGREDTARYLDRLTWAVETECALLGPSGEFDVFALARRLGHRLGLACWAGQEAAGPEGRFSALIAELDRLDASDAFVRPDLMTGVAADGKAVERAALDRLETMLGEALAERAAAEAPEPALVDIVVERWSGVAEPERSSGMARDIVLVHLASMSNLFAALGWMLVDLLGHPEARARVQAGDRAFAERCALESTRLAQRSIMMRAVLAPVSLDDGSVIYEVDPGVVVATLLPLTNTSAAPGLDTFEPDRWNRRRLRDETSLPAREMVTAFGHGAHTCPAQPFSLAAMVAAVTTIIDTFDLDPQFESAEPPPGQIGGVARSARPCPVSYRRR